MKAREVPDVREWLCREWAPGRAFAQTAFLHSPAARYDPEAARGIAIWNYRTLAEGDLWWVSAEMVGLLELAALDFPPLVLTQDEPFTERALVVFESPLEGIDAQHPTEEASREFGTEPGRVLVDAVCWGPALINGEVPSISITSYRHMPPDKGGFWVPLGHSDWPFGTDHSDPVRDDLTEDAAASHAEDRRWLAAMWSLARQPNIVEHTHHAPDRGFRRRAERAGFSSPHVRVVALRRELELAGERELVTEGGRRWYRVRFPVTGHWRQQPYGPGRTLRRPQWIAPYVKGPVGAPIKASEVVRVLR